MTRCRAGLASAATAVLALAAPAWATGPQTAEDLVALCLTKLPYDLRRAAEQESWAPAPEALATDLRVGLLTSALFGMAMTGNGTPDGLAPSLLDLDVAVWRFTVAGAAADLLSAFPKDRPGNAACQIRFEADAFDVFDGAAVARHGATDRRALLGPHRAAVWNIPPAQDGAPMIQLFMVETPAGPRTWMMLANADRGGARP